MALDDRLLAISAYLTAVALAYFIPSPVLAVFPYIGFFLLSFLVSELVLGEGENILSKLVLAFLGGVMALTVAVNALSLAIGYSRLSIGLSFALFSLSAFLLPRKCFIGKNAKQHLSNLKKALAGHKAAAAFCGVMFLFVFSMLSSNLFIPTGDGIVVGGWNYGDFFAHMPIILTVNSGNFPPQVPYLAGAPLVYHWFSDFFTAINSKFSGADPIAFMRFENALYIALFFLSAYLLAFGLSGSRSKSFYAALVVFFAGSLAYSKLAGDLSNPGADPLSLILSKAYDNDWKDFQVPSLLPGILLPQRAMMVGLTVFVLVISLILPKKPGETSRWALAGALSGLSVPFQFYVAPICLLAVFILSCIRPILDKEQVRKSLLKFAAFASMLLITGAPFVLAVLTSGSKAAVGLELGWLAPKDAAGFAWFYVSNLGISFAVFLVAVVTGLLAYANRKKFSGLSLEDFSVLCLLALSLFAIPNVIGVGAIQWDMGKFFAFMAVPAAIVAAFFVFDIASRSGRAARLSLLLAFFLLSSLSSIFTVAWWYENRWAGLSKDDVLAGDWIAANTPKGAVFVAFNRHNSPVDSYAGRYRLASYGWGWVNAIGGGLNENRQALVRQVYCSPSEEASEIAKSLNATYVFLGGDERNNYRCDYPFYSGDAFEKVYSGQSIEIFRVL